MTIYDLKGHEEMWFDTKLDRWAVMRVPGGWVYSSGSYAVFVPFNNEFQKSEK